MQLKFDISAQIIRSPSDYTQFSCLLCLGDLSARRLGRYGCPRRWPQAAQAPEARPSAPKAPKARLWSVAEPLTECSLFFGSRPQAWPCVFVV